MNRFKKVKSRSTTVTITLNKTIIFFKILLLLFQLMMVISDLFWMCITLSHRRLCELLCGNRTFVEIIHFFVHNM